MKNFSLHPCGGPQTASFPRSANRAPVFRAISCPVSAAHFSPVPAGGGRFFCTFPHRKFWLHAMRIYFFQELCHKKIRELFVIFQSLKSVVSLPMGFFKIGILSFGIKFSQKRISSCQMGFPRNLPFKRGPGKRLIEI